MNESMMIILLWLAGREYDAVYCAEHRVCSLLA